MVAAHGTRRRLVAIILVALSGLLFVLMPRTCRADDGKVHSCVGPEACCPSDIADEVPARRKSVDIGVVLIGIHDINEKNSTWSADFYLYEAWMPGAAFVPQTEIFNEMSRVSEQFDRTVLKDGRCVRSRRIRSVLHAGYNLRTFPFDHQTLTLQFSDAEFGSRQLGYGDAARTSGFDDGILQQLSGWKIEEDAPSYTRTTRPFKWEEGAPDYDYATFGVRIRRHVSFHLSKYFLPLLLIVIVAFTVFWIDPEDLASEVQIGVTCLLAAIALQFTEGSSLPDVNYLTIADRAYSICYVAIGLSVVQAVYSNRLTRQGKKEEAQRLDKRSRVAFPVVTALAIAIAVLRAYTQT